MDRALVFGNHFDFKDKSGYTGYVKRCSRCKKEKSLEEFNFKFKKLGIRQKACRECTQIEIRSHYNSNREYYIRKAKTRNKTIRDRNRDYVLKYLSTHACVDCGETDPIVLEFDHIRNKKFDIAFLLRNHTLGHLKTEIDKCEVRCSNCHKRKTAKEFRWYKNRLPL